MVLFRIVFDRHIVVAIAECIQLHFAGQSGIIKSCNQHNVIEHQRPIALVVYGNSGITISYVVIFATAYFELLEIAPIRFCIKSIFHRRVITPLPVIANQRECICPYEIIRIFNLNAGHAAIISIVIAVDGTRQITGRGGSITLELDIFEVIGAVILPLVDEPVDDAPAVRFIGPLEAGNVVIEAVPHFPRIEVRHTEILRIVLVHDSPCLLGQCIGCRREHNDVERMPGTACLGVIGHCGNEIGDAVVMTGAQLFAVAQSDQFGIRHRVQCHRFGLVIPCLFLRIGHEPAVLVLLDHIGRVAGRMRVVIGSGCNTG